MIRNANRLNNLNREAAMLPKPQSKKMKTKHQLKLAGLNLTFAALAVFGAASALAQPGVWNYFPPLSSARSQIGATEVNGRIYAVGGWNFCTPSATVEEYDPTRNVWTRKAQMLTPRGFANVAAVNGVLYAISGQVGCGAYSTAVEAYNVANNYWSARRPMPALQLAGGAAAINSIVYVVGGQDEGAVILNRLMAYDPATDIWTARTPMPSARTVPAVAACNGQLYVMGGIGPDGYLDTVEVYDPASNTWSTRSPMPERRGYASAVVVNGIVYVTGGEASEAVFNDCSSVVAAYNPATDSWTKAPSMNTGRQSPAAAGAGGVLYVLGGECRGSTFASVEALAPQSANRLAFDIDNNGQSDLLLRNTSTGKFITWLMKGATILKSQGLGQPISITWRVAGLGDINGDGRDDILLQHTNGALSFLERAGTNLVNGGMVDSGGAITASWKVVDVVDLNRDGISDLLARHSDGTLAIWFRQGATVATTTPTILTGPPPPLNWRIAGTGDFNGDGRPDILWQSPEGYLFVWFMDNTKYLRGEYLLNGATIGTSWKVVAIADFNYDGKPDLICESNSGYVAVRYLDGTRGISRALLRGGVPVNSVWRIVGPK